VKSFIWLLAFGACLMGCAGENDAVAEQPLTEWQQLSVALKPEVKKGNSKAYSQVVALANLIPAETIEAINTPQKDRDAAQRANLISYGKTFEESVRKLVEGEPWVIELSKAETAQDRMMEDIRFPELTQIKLASKFLYAYSETVGEDGEPELAARACLTNRMLGHQMIQTNCMLITNLVAVAVNAISERSIRESALHGNFSADNFKILQGQGAVKDQSISGLIGAVKNEWWNSSLPMLSGFNFPPKVGDVETPLSGADDELMAFFEQNSKPFDRKATVELGVKIISAQLADLTARPLNFEKSQTLLDDLTEGVPDEETDEMATLKWAKSKENAVGVLLLSVSLPTFGQASLAALKSEASRGLTEVVLAARRGMVETGSLPGSYAELKNFGLPDDVVDPFSGKAFGYDSARGVAWSVGSDGKDDGGLDLPERWTVEAKDWVVRVR
jgi:hypothetical protein